MIIETAIILALGAALPEGCPKHNVFRLPNRTFICKTSRKERGTRAFIPRKEERPSVDRLRNKGYTSVRKALVLKPYKLGSNRYVRRTRRSIRRTVQHILDDYDRDAVIAKIREIQRKAHERRMR